jgi:hypothetical protein
MQRPKFATRERALEEAVRCVRDALDVDDVPTSGATIECEGLVPWDGVLETIEPIQVEEPDDPEGEEAEMWTVLFTQVGKQPFTHVTLAFGPDGALCAAGIEVE